MVGSIHHDHRDVVIATAFVCQIDQCLRQTPKPTLRHDVAQFILRDIVRETVRAQQEAVTGLNDHTTGVHFDVFIEADGPSNDMFEWRVLGLLFGHEAIANLFGNPPMIVGELPDSAFTKQIGAAIASMHQMHPPSVAIHGRQSCPHAMKSWR